MNTKILLFKIATFSILIFLSLHQICSSQLGTGSIAGTISNLNGNALANVNILIVGTNLGTVSDENGNFRIDNLKPGKFTLKILCKGYQTEIRNAIIEVGQIYQLNIMLVEKVLSVQEIVVTPGNFSIAQKQSVKQQVIEQERITAIPATLDDIYCVLQIITGVTFSDDYSAHFHVRGGKQNENLILLDGIEIYDPYHLKNIGGAVGVMNMDIIDNISIMTGGFEAKYGDRLFSVVSIKNRKGSLERFGMDGKLVIH